MRLKTNHNPKGDYTIGDERGTVKTHKKQIWIKFIFTLDKFALMVQQRYKTACNLNQLYCVSMPED